MVRPRIFSRSEIHYLFITEESDTFLPFLPPQEFSSEIFYFLRHLPIDLVQIPEALRYYELRLRTGVDNPYRFGTIYVPSLENQLASLPDTAVVLFFIDGNIPRLEEVLSLLAKHHSFCRYYHFVHQQNIKWEHEHVVSKPGEFVDNLFNNYTEICKKLEFPARDIAVDIPVYEKEFYEYPPFLPAKYNYCLANAIIGNFQNEDPENSFNRDEAIDIMKAELKKAADSEESFDRLNINVEQAKKIDFFSWQCFDHKLINPVYKIDPIFSALVLVAPFQNPDLKDMFPTGDDKSPEAMAITAFRNALSMEQTKNFTNRAKPENVSAMHLVAQFMRTKTEYLDAVAFLHASFNFSPAIRLPYQGRSIYRNLSFFRAEAASFISRPNNRKNIKKTIHKFGVELAERTLSEKLRGKLKTQNRQVVAISDLPIEWLIVDGIPLGFTHDVCRLPETSMNGLMALFAENEHFAYSVSPNILEKTLVIFGNNEKVFKPYQFVVRELSKELGFKTAVCLSVQEAVKAINDFKPDLLIFDCHGGVDLKTKNSYLVLGNEHLTPELIAIHQIHAPLVFLSACSTAPTYGTINTIANAFFGCLSLAVTTTYLPIDIKTSSVLYIRLLNNLKWAAERQHVHKNWLAFVAHVIRTSAISDAINLLKSSKGTSLDVEALNQFHAETNAKLLSFYLRRSLFEELDELIRQMTGREQAFFSNIIPEYLFYSNLGRGDLIKFEIFEKAFRDANS